MSVDSEVSQSYPPIILVMVYLYYVLCARVCAHACACVCARVCARVCVKILKILT